MCCQRLFCCAGPEPPPKPEYPVLCLGLTGVGKSSMLNQLTGDTTAELKPTIGFSIKALVFDDCILSVKELGGGDKIRRYWDRYFGGTRGIIFVVDAGCSQDDLELTRTEVNNVLSHDLLESQPLLILVINKNGQDREIKEVSDYLNLDSQNSERKWIIHTSKLSDTDSLREGFRKLNEILLSEDASAGDEIAKGTTEKNQI